MTLDPKLKEYATDNQWAYLTAYEEHGSDRKAAKALGVAHQSISQARRLVRKNAAKHGHAPEHDMIHPAAPGFAVRRVSTMYDADGEVKLQWVGQDPDKEQQMEAFHAMIKGFTDDLPREKPVQVPLDAPSTELMACYPVGDHHLGMLSWDKETGENYDMEISEKLLIGATAHLIEKSPECHTASIILLGDFLHYDSFESVTPSSRNLLDADGRFPKMLRAGIRLIRNMIQMALTKHHKVNVIVEIGNHDLSSSIFLMECLHNVYENEPRVEIDTSPMHYHYFKFGKCLVGTHHGHGTKMSQLPMVMAADRPEDWGSTKFRYWWTGHIHHDSAKDFHGVKVESFRILASEDAWAHQKGYRSMPGMKSITLHKDFGEVARNTVNPEMLR